jgi:hypothetical protein
VFGSSKAGCEEFLLYWVRWYMVVIPALGRLRQEAVKFADMLGYIREPVINKQQQQNKTNGSLRVLVNIT